MNNECKYCDYVSKCSRHCEYGSYLCCLNRSFPKVVDKSYKELQKEVEKLQHYKTLYQSLKRQKDEVVEYVEKHLTDNGRFLMLNEWQVPDLLRILKEVE